MKEILFILICICIFSCNKTNTTNTEEINSPIIGKWKFNKFTESLTQIYTDYADECSDKVYIEFKKDGTYAFSGSSQWKAYQIKYHIQREDNIIKADSGLIIWIDCKTFTQCKALFIKNVTKDRLVLGFGTIGNQNGDFETEYTRLE